MDAASNMHSCLYRSGYDISLPLNPKKIYGDLAETAPLERRFFLTLKARNAPKLCGDFAHAQYDVQDFARLKSRLKYSVVVQQLAGLRGHSHPRLVSRFFVSPDT